MENEHKISIASANNMKNAYKEKYPNEAVYFNSFKIDTINSLLDTEGAAGIRHYFAIDAKNDPQVILVAVDKEHIDIKSENYKVSNKINYSFKLPKIRSHQKTVFNEKIKTDILKMVSNFREKHEDNYTSGIIMKEAIIDLINKPSKKQKESGPNPDYAVCTGINYDYALDDKKHITVVLISVDENNDEIVVPLNTAMQRAVTTSARASSNNDNVTLALDQSIPSPPYSNSCDTFHK